MYYVHKMGQCQSYGGPEEGGWWWDKKWPLLWDEHGYEPPVPHANEEEAFAHCRALNKAEYERRAVECRYGYTSVLSHRDNFYTYDVTESYAAVANQRPHYE